MNHNVSLSFKGIRRKRPWHHNPTVAREPDKDLRQLQRAERSSVKFDGETYTIDTISLNEERRDNCERLASAECSNLTRYFTSEEEKLAKASMILRDSGLCINAAFIKAWGR